MNGMGTWYGNAATESFFDTLRSEPANEPRVHRTHDKVRMDLFFYIDGFYDQRRHHSSLNCLSLGAHEQRCH
jgi:transposase InsO family protein